MALYIQDPDDRQAPVLHEKILEICEGAEYGAGAFAFVSREGVNLLLRDDVFVRFATIGHFQLIVGVDEITNPRALLALQEVSQNLPGLCVRVFYHTPSQSIFHPKFCWFRHRASSYLVTGSGNLTTRGLRGNWEAFSINELDLTEADRLEAQWSQWIDFHSNQLKSVDDANVLVRASENVYQQRRVVRHAASIEQETDTEDLPSREEFPLHPVLVAEIPRASSRWNQANFDLYSFRNFFGAQPGTTQRIVLQHVSADGSLETLENRPSVAVMSQNYRFELEAAAGLPYPDIGRPIAVFVEIASRTFRYRLLMPNDPDYGIMLTFLNEEWTGRTDRMRRIITNTEILMNIWPNSPLWVRSLDVEE